MNFDQTLQYQFVLFYLESGEGEATELKELAAIVSQQVPGAKSFGLKLGTREQAFVVPSRPGLTPMSAVQWSAGSGIWKLSWSPVRLDLTFDAAGFADIAAGFNDDSSPPTLRAIIDRVSSNLVEVVKISSRPITRLALVVTGKSSCSVGRSATEIVARNFFTEEIISDVMEGRIRDLNARVNSLGTLNLTFNSLQSKPIRLNQIENGTSAWQYEDGTESTSLTWQYDVNTSPSDLKTEGFDKSAIPEFLNFAEKWVSSRLRNLEELSASN